MFSILDSLSNRRVVITPPIFLLCLYPGDRHKRGQRYSMGPDQSFKIATLLSALSPRSFEFLDLFAVHFLLSVPADEGSLASPQGTSPLEAVSCML